MLFDGDRPHDNTHNLVVMKNHIDLLLSFPFSFSRENYDPYEDVEGGYQTVPHARPSGQWLW